MQRTNFVLLVLLTLGVSSWQSVDADEKPGAGKITPAEVKLGRPVDFSEDVLPILEENCIACHNLAIAENKLSLEDLESILKGGKSGPAVVAKQPDKSLLYQVAARAKEPHMPPLPNDVSATPLTPKELGLLRLWIAEGAAAGMGGGNQDVQWSRLSDGLRSIYSVALSHWGELAVVGRTNQLYVYQVRTGDLLGRLTDPALAKIMQDDQPMYPEGAAHRDFIHSLAVSPDGTTIASGGYRVVKLWNRQRNVQRQKLAVPENVSAMAVSANGAWIATAAADHKIVLWDTKTGKPAVTLEGHTARVNGLVFWPTVAEQARVNQAVRQTEIAVSAAARKLQTARKALATWQAKSTKKDNDEQKALTDAIAAAEKSHTDAVAAVAVAQKQSQEFAEKIAKQTRLVSGSEDKSIRVWDPAAGTASAQLDTPAPVTSVVFNVDATMAISGHSDNIARVWSLQPEKADAKPADDKAGDQAAEPTQPTLEIKGHSKPITSLALVGPAGTQLVSGSADGTVRVWDLKNGKQIRSLNHGGAVSAVVVRPDGKFAASAGMNNVSKLWQLSDGKQIAEMKGDLTATRGVQKLTDDQTVAKKHFALADAAFKAAEKNVKDRTEAAKKAKEAKEKADKAIADPQKKAKESADALAKAKQELAAKADDAALKKKVEAAQKAADAATAALKKATDTQASAQRALQLADKAVVTAQAGQKVATAHKTAMDAGQKAAENVLNAAKKAETEMAKPVHGIAFSADGKTVATAGVNPVIQLWDATTGQAVDTLTGQSAAVSQLAYDMDSGLISVSVDKTLVVWETRPDWQLAATLGPKTDTPLAVNDSTFVGRVLSLDFSRDGSRLATGGGDPSRSGELMVWDVAKRTLVKEFKDAHSDTVFGVEFSRDGKFLLSGAADKFVKIFELESGKHVKSFEGHTHHVMDVSWQADGSVVVSAGADNAIKIWNVETGEQKRTISNYSKQVTAIQFVGVGENIISCGGDKSVRFHKTSNGQNYRSFSGATDFMYAAAASRDESIVIAGGGDGVLRIWNGKNGSSLATLEADTR
ncbi:MAG: c-type cytochrome domain-containing protein [Planctomycetaceae bacterium]